MTKEQKTKHIIALLLLSYAFFFYGIGDYSLKEPDEGRYAEIPREMNELHDYVVPHLNYVRYFEKPPLLYWTTAASFKLFGTNEWAFRFPNALSAFLCVIFLYFFIRRWFNEQMAFLSSIILITSFSFLAMARIVTTDMLFTMCLFLSLLLFYGYYREKKPFFIYLFYVAIAAATLAKGPVALILMGGTILIFLFTERNFRFIMEMKLIKGLAIYLTITLPWIIAISLREKEFLYFFFMDQHILRFLTSKHKRSGPIYYFLPVLFGGMFPWSIFIPRAIANTWKNKELRLMLIWVFVVFAFFSVSGSKLPPYILPLFPPIAIILGYLFHEKWQLQVINRVEISIYILIFLTIGAAALLSQISPLSVYIQNMAEDNTVSIMKDLLVFSLWVSLSSFIIVFFLIFKRFTTHTWSFILLSSYSLAIMFGILFNLAVVDKLNTAKNIATMINGHKAQADYIIDYSSYDQTIPFYIKQGITVASYTGELEMGSKYEDAKNIFISEEEFLKLLSSDKKILFVTKQKRLKRLQEMFPERIRIQGCQNNRCLVSNY
jgi:4-amino-4-deoxy-L-arabinose transferase-like glycosyltransferase